MFVLHFDQSSLKSEFKIKKKGNKTLKTIQPSWWTLKNLLLRQSMGE